MPLFVGNVLPPTGVDTENDPTFDFSSEESKNLQLKDIPIRIEHEDLYMWHLRHAASACACRLAAC